MKLGIPGWAGQGSFGMKTVEAVALGADYAEFSLDYPWPDAIGRGEIKQSIRIGRKKGFRFAFHSPYGEINMASPRPKLRKAAVETIKDTIRFAKRFNPLYYNLHPTANLPTTLGVVDGVAEVVLASFLRSLGEISKFAKKEKVPLTIENTIEPFFGQPEYVELFLKVPNVKFCFDVGHAELLKLELEGVGLKGKGVEWWIKRFGNRIHTCHFQDVLDMRDNVVLGKGTRNWKRWLRLLKKTKVKNLLLETQFSGEDEQASLEEFHEELGVVRRLLG